MTLQRKTTVVPGYDCRVACMHDPPAPGRGGHGMHSDTWIFTVYDRDRGALSLDVGTPYYPETVNVHKLPPSLVGFSGRNLGMCVPWRTRRESVREGTEPGECPFLGRCFPFANWALLAEEFVQEHFRATARSATPIQSADFWAALETRFEELYQRASEQRRSDGDLAYMQCPHCGGTGTLET